MQGLRNSLPSARWVRPEGVHLTLKFLGDTAPETLQSLVADLTPVLAGLPPVTVELSGSGVFPNQSRPRVAWLGGSAPGAAAVAAAIDRAARRHGCEPERRPWSLHLTLARMREPWPREAVEEFLQWGNSTRLEPFRCDQAQLISSVLKPDGAVYTPLETLPLGAIPHQDRGLTGGSGEPEQDGGDE